MPSVEQDASAVELLLAIKALPLFANLHADELAVIVEHVRMCTFRAGDAVFANADGPVDSIHLVLDGRVVEHRNGRPFRTHDALRVLGGVDALAQTATEVHATAEVDTRTLALDRAALRDVLEDNFNVLSVTLQGIAAAILRLRRDLVPSAGFRARTDAPSVAPDDLDDLGARIAFLRRHWVGHARIRTLGQLARDAELVEVAAGASLWDEHEAAEHAAVVVRGVVACATADGRQRFEAGEGAVVGLEETLAIALRWCGAVAHGPVTLLRLTRAAIVDALEDDSDTALEAVSALATIASELRDRVAAAAEETS